MWKKTKPAINEPWVSSSPSRRAEERSTTISGSRKFHVEEEYHQVKKCFQWA